MFNKESCRSCGKNLVPFLKCNYCNEHISWICNKCQRVEDVSHKHEREHGSHEGANLEFRDSVENGMVYFHNA